MNTLPDHQLLSLLNSPEREVAGNELYRRYRHLIFGVAFKYLQEKEQSEDVVSQVLELLLNQTSEKILHLQKWLYIVTINTCHKHYRNNNNLIDINLENNHNYFVENEYYDTLNNIEVSERNIHLQKAIETLPINQKKCIDLFYFNECTYNEIANKLNFTLQEVKTNLQNGKRNIRIYFNKLKYEK
ncbi:MAG: sigma-70 family RNA polymerase sigma factor [Saprospiraceae bacterium]|nr:sigma-70 family RNA polymerase sigma factor [Saprospiraceae bacterium]